jgi:hypothetical protein
MLVSFPSTVWAESLFPFRGDRGLLDNFRPHAAVWLSEDRILVADQRFNNLQIFDTEGRRFRLFDAASNAGPAHFVGMTQLGPNEFLILGSHYHEKNHPRYRDQRSRIHRFYLDLEKEELRLEDLEVNLSPDEPLRKTRMYGSTPLRQLEFAGIGVDEKKDIVWFGLAQPKSEEGNLALLRCSLQDLLTQNEDLEFTEVDTGFALPLETRCQLSQYLTDLKVLDDGSLLFLTTADDLQGKRLCTNTLWRYVPGREVVKVKDELVPENRATGMALKSLGGGEYRLALVCDNVTEETGLPSRLVILNQPLKLH